MISGINSKIDGEFDMLTFKQVPAAVFTSS